MQSFEVTFQTFEKLKITHTSFSCTRLSFSFALTISEEAFGASKLASSIALMKMLRSVLILLMTESWESPRIFKIASSFERSSSFDKNPSNFIHSLYSEDSVRLRV